MVIQYLDYLVFRLLPDFFGKLNSLQIVPGVSFLGFCIAVSIICIGIGAILMRV